MVSSVCRFIPWHEYATKFDKHIHDFREFSSSNSYQTKLGRGVGIYFFIFPFFSLLHGTSSALCFRLWITFFAKREWISCLHSFSLCLLWSQKSSLHAIRRFTPSNKSRWPIHWHWHVDRDATLHLHKYVYVITVVKSYVLFSINYYLQGLLLYISLAG